MRSPADHQLLITLEAQQWAGDDVGSLDPGLILAIGAGPGRGRRALAAEPTAEAAKEPHHAAA